MSQKTFFDKVYAAADADALQQVYEAHAGDYDAALREAGYVTPTRIAVALAAQMHDLTRPVLDFGCGTGLSGHALRQEGFTTLDGLDVSDAMLAEARAKGVYRTLHLATPGDPIPQGYTAVVASGAISVGAAPPEALDTLVESLAKGTYFALSFNDHTLATPAYTDRLAAFRQNGTLITLIEEHGPHLPDLDMGATIYIFRKG